MNLSVESRDAWLGDYPFQHGAFDPSIRTRISTYARHSCSKVQPLVSFVVPVHNQGRSIRRNLNSILSHSATRNEMIVIVDGCTDNTPNVVHAWAGEELKLTERRTDSITIVETNESVFETIADSIGFVLSRGKYIVEAQADMTIKHPSFDVALVSTLEQNADVFLVGGRGTHSFKHLIQSSRLKKSTAISKLARVTIGRALDPLVMSRVTYKPTLFEMYARNRVGRLGHFIELEAEIPSDGLQLVYLHETVMRGPIAIARDSVIDLGGLDSANFFLGNDEHDLAMRAWLVKGLRTAYLPIKFDSPLGGGSTRAAKSAEEIAEYGRLSAYYDERFPESFLGRHIDGYPRPSMQRRALCIGQSGATTSTGPN